MSIESAEKSSEVDLWFMAFLIFDVWGRKCLQIVEFACVVFRTQNEIDKVKAISWIYVKYGKLL